MWTDRRCAAQFRGLAPDPVDYSELAMALDDQLKAAADTAHLVAGYETDAEAEESLESLEFYCEQQTERRRMRYC